MKPSNSEKEFYLDSSFDYSKLTKMELRDIMSINNIDEIPPLSAKKDVILQAYKTNIHDRIEQIKKARNFSRENIFQSESESEMSNIEHKRSSIIGQQSVHERCSIGSVRHDSSNKVFEESPTTALTDSHHSDDSSFFDSSGQSSLKKNISKIKKNRIVLTVGKNNRKGEGSMSDINQSSVDVIKNPDTGNTSGIFNKSNVENNQSISELSNRSFTSETSNGTFINSVYNSASSVQNIPLSDKATKQPTFTNVKPVCFNIRKFLISFLLLTTLWYLKFRSPYCENGRRWCIPPPSNSHILNGQMICNPGFVKVKSIIDHCVPESMKTYQVEAFRIVKELEYIHGEYIYKLRATPDVPISSLTINQKVIKILKELSLDHKNGKVNGLLGSDTDIHKKQVIFNDNKIRAVRYRISTLCFLHFYASILIKIVISFLTIYIVTRLVVQRIRRNRIYRIEAVEKMKDVNDILSRQLLIALKTDLIRPYVYIEQIKSVLNISDNVWYYVKELVNTSCNIEVRLDEERRVQWKWIGPILLKGEAEDSSNNNIF